MVTDSATERGRCTVEKWMKVSEAAAVMSVSLRTVQRLCASGDLAFAKIGKAVRIKEADVVAYMAKAVGK